MQLDSLVTIGITTKNRFQDLNQTLRKLVELDLNHLPIIIYDDASDSDIADPDCLNEFSKLTLLRKDYSRGYIVNRNQMVKICETPFLISLDDDSCFLESPPLLAAIRYLEANPKLAALEFLNIETAGDPYSLLSQIHDKALCTVKSYTGCSHILRKDIFLELGGYREYFVHMVEESDFAQRAWRAGYQIHKFPSVLVHHRQTSVARVSDRIAYYNARNIVLCNLLNKPIEIGLLRAIGAYPAILWKTKLTLHIFWKITQGWLSGFIFVIQNWHERTAMTRQQCISYQKLPSLVLEKVDSLVEST
jgi:GT2 family glycosyltransferase